MRSFFIFILLGGLSFIAKGQDSSANTIEIYLLKQIRHDSMCTARYCFYPKQEDLADTAFISNEEIIAYEISAESSHYIILSDAALKRLRNLNNTSNEKDNFVSRAFAMVINGKPVYGGWFRSRYISVPADWIVINTPFDEDKTGKLKICPTGLPVHLVPEVNKKLINNSLILDCLKGSKRLQMP